jgi:hypothetical protein
VPTGSDELGQILHTSYRHSPLSLLNNRLWCEIKRVVKADSKCFSLENKTGQSLLTRWGQQGEEQFSVMETLHEQELCFGHVTWKQSTRH